MKTTATFAAETSISYNTLLVCLVDQLHIVAPPRWSIQEAVPLCMSRSLGIYHTVDFGNNLHFLIHVQTFVSAIHYCTPACSRSSERK